MTGTTGAREDVAVLRRELAGSTGRLLAAADRLDAATVAAPSPLPGWTRGHVLAHLTGNADGTVRLLHWAATGERSPKYASYPARNAEIEELAVLPWPELRDRVRAAAARLDEAMGAFPEESWDVVVPTAAGGTGQEMPAHRVLWTRLRELEIHLVDLDAGYTPAHWDASFADRVVRESLERLRTREDAPPLVVEAVDTGTSAQVGTAEGAVMVSGPVRALAAWLTGRGTGDGLVTEPPGALPQLPPWG